MTPLATGLIFGICGVLAVVMVGVILEMLNEFDLLGR